ncbi:MAG: type II secretion system minor pseudopilin GspI [Pseudomonadota bacterium]
MKRARTRHAGRLAHRVSAAGFTLVEVLVALGIVAIALTAGVRATGALTRNAQRQSDAVLAQLCAENELVRVRLSRQLPGIGDTTVACEQAGRVFNVTVGVRSTPNPSFRRVDAQVDDGSYPVLRLTTIVGRY